MIDLRSDTVTRPTPEMRRAMAEAEVGDDVYREDPTVNRLEEMAAEMTGKEAALFVASGTMGNQVALMAHTRRGDEVLLEAESHIFFYEAGGMAVLSGLMPFPIRTDDGILRPADLEGALRPADIHFPRPSLVCLENTHNRHGGRVAGAEEIAETCDFAHVHGLKVHLDGARIFNAAVALGIDVRGLVEDVDSVMFCLSKGLCAPVGSMLAGTRDFIAEARRCRKLLGGGMRQAGVLAAAGIVALKTMIDRLSEDHENARVLAEGLAEIPGIDLDPSKVRTNIIIFEISKRGWSARRYIEELKKHGISADDFSTSKVRMVTHKDVSRDDVLRAVNVTRRILS